MYSAKFLDFPHAFFPLFSAGRVPSSWKAGDPARMADVYGVLEPLLATRSAWERGDLVCVYDSVKSVIIEVYGLDKEGCCMWHSAIADFYISNAGDKVRAVDEFPHHLKEANRKQELVDFLSNASWTMEFVGQRRLDELYSFWFWTGKSRLSLCYLNIVPRQQCWGCMTRSNKSVAWVHDMLRKMVHEDAEEREKSAERVEAELTKKSGGRITWESKQILEHLASHNAFTSEENVVAVIERTFNDEKKLQAAAAAVSTRVPTAAGAVLNSESGAQIEKVKASDLHAAMGDDDVNMDERMVRMRFVIMVLLEGITRITQHRHQMRHRKARVQDQEINRVADVRLAGGRTAGSEVREAPKTDLQVKVEQERVVIAAMFDALIFYGEDRYSDYSETCLSDRVVSPEDTTVAVDDLSAIGISEKTFFPVPAKIGDEVVSIIGISGQGRLQLKRHKSKAKTHTSGYLVQARLILGGGPSSYNVKVRLCTRLKVKMENVSVSQPEAKGHASFECHMSIFVNYEHEADELVTLLDDNVFVEWKEHSENSKFFLKRVAGRTEVAQFKPRVHARVISPNRNLAFDYFRSGHLHFCQGDMKGCEGLVRRAYDMASRASHDPPRDHLLVQCATFLWLLNIRSNRTQEAAQQIQEMLEVEVKTKANPSPLHGQVREFDRATELRQQVIDASRFAASNPVEFRRRVRKLESQIIPTSLSEKDSATFCVQSFLWLDLNLIRGQGMAVMDSSGFSDPFVTAVISGQTRKSSVKMRDLNPIWDEHLIFTGVPTNSSLTITLNVWDYDTDNRQELIGMSKLSLADALDQEGSPMVLRVSRNPKPFQHTLCPKYWSLLPINNLNMSIPTCRCQLIPINHTKIKVQIQTQA